MLPWFHGEIMRLTLQVASGIRGGASQARGTCKAGRKDAPQRRWEVRGHDCSGTLMAWSDLQSSLPSPPLSLCASLGTPPPPTHFSPTLPI